MRLPVTRLTASALQKVRTSAKIWARLVNRHISNMQMPLSASFSVATMYGARMPFQSNELLRIASEKSPLGL